MLRLVFAFGLDPYVVNVNNILAFGSRVMSFWHEVLYSEGQGIRAIYSLD
jgi:hypothetical protein